MKWSVPCVGSLPGSINRGWHKRRHMMFTVASGFFGQCYLMQFWISVLPTHTSDKRLNWTMENFWICPRSGFCAAWLYEEEWMIWFPHLHFSGKVLFSDVIRWGKSKHRQQSWSVGIFVTFTLKPFGCQPGSFSGRVVSMLFFSFPPLVLLSRLYACMYIPVSG